jgi:spermidine/putrescine transport system substrate-binding protein
VGRGFSYIYPTEADAGVWFAAALRHEWLPGLGNLDSRFGAPVWDRELQWSIPYMWFGTGIVYNRDVQPAPKRWADLWDTRFKGRLTMLDDPEDVLGACLKKLGLSFSATDPVELQRARQEAIAQKPLVRAYLNAEVRDQLVSGDVLAAQLWATTAQQAIDGAPNLAFTYPEEGFPFYCDCAMILRESERSRLAHQFLDYLLRPKVAAAAAEYTRVATANGVAKPFLLEPTRNNPTLYPPPEIYERGEWPQSLPPAAQRLRDRIWTEIKSS